jgi:PP-loop superfamily ATP-utilizing enzyme
LTYNCNLKKYVCVSIDNLIKHLKIISQINSNQMISTISSTIETQTRASKSAMYQSRYLKAKRIRNRLANGKIRVKEIPPEAVEEMKEMKELDLSYESIAKLFRLSRYMVVTALEGYNSEETKKHLEKVLLHN